MHSLPKISIVIPVYNVEKYLRQCLESVINQTLQDIEIICVDDGSTDNSLKILRDYASKDRRIKILTLKATRTEWLFIILSIRSILAFFLSFCYNNSS